MLNIFDPAAPIFCLQIHEELKLTNICTKKSILYIIKLTSTSCNEMVPSSSPTAIAFPSGRQHMDVMFFPKRRKFL